MLVLPDNKTISAPLAGISDTVFCSWALKYGAGLVFSGMISAEGVRRKTQKTLFLLDIARKVKPIGIQLFDDKPSAIAEAAPIIEDLGVECIDINFGCPARKVIKKGAGVSLMADLSKMESIMSAAVKSVSIPVSAKIRTGLDDESLFKEAILRLSDAGAAFITLHARSRKQGFSGHADWSKIAEAVELSPVPIIGNGDVNSAESAVRMIKETGCSAVMIGRAALGNPWIFSQVSSALTGGEIPPEPSLDERLAACSEFILDMGEYFGDLLAGKLVKKHVGWFTKGMPEGRAIRSEAYKFDKASDIAEFLKKERGKSAS
ncbi:tRNA dihydrouridine synthase DusB [bacterium]|nr:tRNA dihydrouridine synthase DusB [bacterium]